MFPILLQNIKKYKHLQLALLGRHSVCCHYIDEHLLPRDRNSVAASMSKMQKGLEKSLARSEVQNTLPREPGLQDPSPLCTGKGTHVSNVVVHILDSVANC